MKSKQLLWPKGAQFFDEVKTNMCAFPELVNDDDVDAVSYFAVASTKLAGDPGYIQTMSLDEAYDLDELYGEVGEIVRDFDTTGMRLLQLRGRLK